MSFKEQIAETAQAVESAMDTEISQASGPEVPARLVSAMREAVFGGGKRFRPFLVIESARLFGVAPELTIKTASAVEFIHCYSLVHDDLPAMDNDPVRRGKASIWAAYDDWTAILVGDALQSLAFQLISSPSAHPEASIRVELAQQLAIAAGAQGMVGGQALDLAADKLCEPERPSLADIRKLQSMKTGALIRFSCEAGAILGQADVAHRSALRAFGDYLGRAFQIADDLLDVEGNADIVGKTLAKDNEAGKATLVSLMGIDASRRELANTETLAIEALSLFGAEADTLRAAARFAARREL